MVLEAYAVLLKLVEKGKQSVNRQLCSLLHTNNNGFVVLCTLYLYFNEMCGFGLTYMIKII